MVEDNTVNKVVNLITCSFNRGGIKLKICPQDVQGSIIISDYTDLNFPGRSKALHPRMKGKIPKMVQSEYVDADYYIWADSSFTIHSPNFVQWLINSLSGNEIAFFKHPERSSIKEELNFMQELMANNNQYLLTRYTGEPMAEQVDCYLSDTTFKDNVLISAGMFIYTKEFLIKYPTFMRDWLLENVLWSVQDQLSLPYMLHKHNVAYTLIDGNILNNNYCKYTG